MSVIYTQKMKHCNIDSNKVIRLACTHERAVEGGGVNSYGRVGTLLRGGVRGGVHRPGGSQPGGAQAGVRAEGEPVVLAGADWLAGGWVCHNSSASFAASPGGGAASVASSAL